MKRLLYIFIIMILPLQMFAAKIGVYDVKTENLKNPEGIDITTPRFSWKISSDGSNVVQTEYQIIVASSPEKLDEANADLWNSGRVKSANQLWVEYHGKALKSNDKAFWKLRVFTNKGKSEWSEVQHFGITLLGENKWKGNWIGLEELQTGEQRGLHTRLAVRYLRKEFKSKKNVRRAMAYVAGLGLYDFYVNGKQIGDNQVLKPVPSDYRKTVYYNTFDITRYIQANNAIGISLGAGRYFPMRQEKYYKSPVFGLPKCRINIIVEYEDGTKETWATDQSWKLSFNGPIRNTNEYDGEEYDARMEMSGWNTVGFDDSKWINLKFAANPFARTNLIVTRA